MAKDTGTVELPTETTDEPAPDDALAAVHQAMFGDEQQEPGQKSEPEAAAPEAEEPPPTTEPAPEAEPEAPAAETEPEEPEALSPEAQESIDRRIGKEVAKRKELEEQLAERDARLAELEAKVTAPKEEAPVPQAEPGEHDPVLQVPEIKAIYDQETKARTAHNESNHFLRQIARDPDKALAELKERLPKANFPDVESARDFLERVKDDSLVKMNQFQTKRELATHRHMEKQEKLAEKHQAEVLKFVPALLDSKSKEGQIVKEILARWPLLKSPAHVPDGWQVIGDMVLGRLAREAKAAAPAATKAPAQVPPKLSAPAKAAVPARPPANGKPQLSVLRKQAEETGSPDDVARLIEAVI